MEKITTSLDAPQQKSNGPSPSLISASTHEKLPLPTDPMALKVIRPDYAELVRARAKEVRTGERAADL